MIRLLAPMLFVTAIALPGQTWTEDGDAGDLPGTAQLPVGAGPLTQISGVILDLDIPEGPGNDRDMYLIQIDNPAAFEATTFAPLLNPQLFLFDINGHGVSFNDNDPTLVGFLQPRLTGLFVPAPGPYYLAVSRSDRGWQRDLGGRTVGG